MVLQNLHDVPFYYKSIDFEELVREYPPAPDYFRGVFMLSVEEIRELQERRIAGSGGAGLPGAFLQEQVG